MATQGLGTMIIPRSERRGSIALVLLVAVLLVAAAAGLMVVGRHAAGPYVTIFLAVLAVIGVFALFALAAGVLRVSARESGGPMLKRIIDNANDGIVVTDSAGRVLFANAAYRLFADAVGEDEVRPVERVFVGDPDVSEAVYRLRKAAQEGRRLQEEVRIAGPRGRAGAVAATAGAAARRRERGRRFGVDRRRRHPRPRAAGERLPGAPARNRLPRPRAGRLLLGRWTWRHRLSQRDARRLARLRSRPGRLGRLAAVRHPARRQRGAAHHAFGSSRRSQNRGARPRPAPPRRPHAAGAPPPQGRVRLRRDARRVADPRSQPRRRRRQRSPAHGGSALHALLPQHADGDRDRRPARPHRPHQCAVRPAGPERAQGRAGGAARAAPSSASSPSATA